MHIQMSGNHPNVLSKQIECNNKLFTCNELIVEVVSNNQCWSVGLKGQVVKKEQCKWTGESTIDELHIEIQDELQQHPKTEEKGELIEVIPSTSGVETEKAAELVQKGGLKI